MKSSLRTFFQIASILVSLWLCSPSKAQPPGSAAGGLELASEVGELQMVLGPRLKLKLDDGQEIIVVTSSKSELSYSNTAELAFLRPGMLVRFTAPFDAGGTSPNQLKELEVFVPLRKPRMSPEQLQSQTPGVYPAAEDEEKEAKPGNKPATDRREARAKANRAAEPRSRNRRAADRSPAAAQGDVQNYLVVGQLRAMAPDQSAIQIAAGNRPVTINIDPDLEISVVTSDLSFAQPGDEVEVEGLRNAAQASVIQAQSIEISGSQPLGSDLKQQPSRRRGAAPRQPAAEEPKAEEPAGERRK